MQATPFPLAEPDITSGRTDGSQDQTQDDVSDLDRQTAKIAEMEIVVRCRRLLPKRTVGKAGPAKEAAATVEIIVFAEDQAARRGSQNLDVLPARQWIVQGDVGQT